jgi:hypothetical protein
MADTFSIIFLASVLSIRLFLFVAPVPSPTIGRLRVHHYMYGFIGAPIALILHSMPLYAISLALVVDEATYVSIGGRTHSDNYSFTSLIGTAILAAVVVILRNSIVTPLR